MRDDAAERRRPARWLAFLLNLIFFPAGYVYVGAVRWAVAALIGLILVSLALVVWTVGAPPGIYQEVLPGVAALTLVAPVLALACAVHAVWLARTSDRRLALWPAAALAIGFWLTPLLAAHAVRAFAPGAVYSVQSDSMSPTLATGDILLSGGDRTLCGDARVTAGDIIFSRKGGVIYSHRAVAGPGQTVEIKSGVLLIDGRPPVRVAEGSVPTNLGAATVIRETLANGKSYLTLDLGEGEPGDEMSPVRIPPDHWFALGDNRDNAVDSRFQGPVPSSSICGVAIRVLNSSDPAALGTRP